MGGKSSKPKIDIVRYYLAEHFGICVAADKLKRVVIKEKDAWIGSQDVAGSFTIDKDQLFGGQSKEGGIQAVVYWLPGAADQVLPDELAQKLGRANGADAPGYRGMATAFFTGPKGTPFENFWDDHIEGRGGAYWSVNSPYLPPVWLEVERAPIGLNPDYAMVPWVTTSLPLIEGETVELTWWQRSLSQPNVDEARMAISFHSQDGTQIGATETVAYESGLTWTERSISTVAPTGACITRIYQESVRHWGVVIDGYIDDITLEIGGSAVDLVNPGAETSSGGGSHPGWITLAGGLNHKYNPATAHSGDKFFHGTGSYSLAYQQIIPTFVGADANPAHIIYESLTNTDWGMGSPATAIEIDSFEEAGVTLYGEGFGLSMIWTRQSTIEDFIQEVLDHIMAVLFVDPSSGLLTLKLIRADYAVDGLPDINPSNATLSRFERKTWGNIVNEIVVTWTNPATEQDETVTVQDLASIVTQGIVSDSRNYYGVRNPSLASRLGQRELRSSGAPLASCEVEIDRTLWRLRPASVVTVTWPEHGLAGVVMRAMSINYGKPGDMRIRVSLLEDVFGLDAGDYIDPPTTGWIDPSTAPDVTTFSQIFTLPLFFAASTNVSAFVDTPEYPEVLAGVLATSSNDDTSEIELWDEVTLPDASLQWQMLSSLTVLGHALLVDALAAEAESTITSFASVIGGNGASQGGFIIIGDGEEDEVEIALITAIGADVEVDRGVLDTVPRAWPASTPVWFVDGDVSIEDPNVRSAGEEVSYKLLPRTSLGLLPLASASLETHELTERPWLPNRPADVTAYGADFNTVATPVDAIARPDPWVTVAWANRNRLLEETQVLSWTDATVDPEDGQTTTIEVFAVDGVTLLDTHDGLTGTTFDVPDSSFGAEAIVLIHVSSERTDADGTFKSLQAHRVWVQVALGDPITEQGDGIITEDGDDLILEG